jgi:hypothetical protein
VIANTEEIRVRSEKFHCGTGLRRCNRSRGFSAKFARHRNLHVNYRIFQGLICKKLGTASHGDRRPLFLTFPSILTTGERGKRGR